MIRPILAQFLQRVRPERMQPDLPIATSENDPREVNAAVAERERLPPRDDSFYLGLCISHW